MPTTISTSFVVSRVSTAIKIAICISLKKEKKCFNFKRKRLSLLKETAIIKAIAFKGFILVSVVSMFLIIGSNPM